MADDIEIIEVEVPFLDIKVVEIEVDELGIEVVEVTTGMGPQGPAGPMGPQGPKGDKGDPGGGGGGSLPDPGPNQIGATYRAVSATEGEWRGGSSSRINAILGQGQSNGAGARNGGPNPASPLVHVYNAVANAWGSSDYTQAPWNLPNPNGNNGNNNTQLALAHRFADETGLPTYLGYYWVGGTSINHWVDDGNTGGNGDFYVAMKARAEWMLASPEFVAANKTTFDVIHIAQGEEDYLMDFATYLAKWTLWIQKLRAETWVDVNTPILITGPSNLHERYFPEKAQQYFSSFVDANVFFVNSRGLTTDSDTGGSDFTHFTGPSLWELGYQRCWASYKTRLPSPKYQTGLIWARGTGLATPATPQWIVMCDSLTNNGSRDRSSAAVNSLSAATGSISWGEQCSADGNYTYCFGWQVTTSNLCNYTSVIGRDSSATDNGDYSGVFGFQNINDAPYSLVAGRGHTNVGQASLVTGYFSEFTTIQTDPVVLQHGIGTSASSRRNVITGKQSGALKVGASFALASLPSAANAGKSFVINVSDGSENQGCVVTSDGTVWRKLSETDGYRIRTETTGAITLSPIKSSYRQDWSAVVPTGNIAVTLDATAAYNGSEFFIIPPTNLNGRTFTAGGVVATAGQPLRFAYAGSWKQVKGEVGPQGIQGVAGADGAQGVKGDKGDKGDPGISEPIAVTPDSNTLVMRNDFGAIYAHGLTIAQIVGEPTGPNVGLPSSPILADGGTLNPTGTFYYHFQFVTPAIQTYTMPELTVEMNGHNEVQFILQQRPEINGVPIYVVIIQRSSVKGDYTDPNGGCVVQYFFTGDEIYPLTLSDTGQDLLGPFPLDSTTSLWSISEGGMVHQAQGIFGKLSVLNALAANAIGLEVPHASWVLDRIAEKAPPKRVALNAEFINPAAGRQVDIVLPHDLTVTGFKLIGDVAGSATLSVWRKNNDIPTSGDSVASMSITTASYLNDTAATGWTDTTLDTDDVLRVNIDSADTFGRLTLVIVGNT